MSLSDGFTHLWEFEADAGSIVDLIGVNDLTITGTQIPAVNGKINKAGDFRTTQNYATLQGSTAGLDGVDELTVLSWLWTPDNPASTRRAWITQAGTGALIRASIGPTNRPFVQMFNASESISVVAPADKEFVREAWVHLGYTFERGVGAVLYMNGQPVISAPQTVDEATATGGSLALNLQARDGTGGGAGTGSESLDGQQDQFGIWNRALTANEVRQVVFGGFGMDLEAVAMAAVAQQSNIVMAAAGDVFSNPLVATLIRFVPDAGASLAGDRVVLTDPVTTEILWEMTVQGPNVPESDPQAAGDRNNRTWPNGAVLSTLTGDRGTLYIRY